MSAPMLHDTSPEAPESPLLAIFALLVVLGVVAIGLMLAVPTAVTMVVAFAAVVGSAVAVTYLLARVIGDG